MILGSWRCAFCLEEMYKNQLQELAQRSCFNLPSYSCMREGPDHAPRFKATVNFNGEVFESPNYCSTLRQAEHSAAEVALNILSKRGPSQSLAARLLDETGVYKNLLQEISQRAGAALPVYTTVRSGLGHLPVFTCTVELAGINFTGEPAKNKKQAEKNAAMAAWSSLKQLPHQSGLSSQTSSEGECNEEQEQITIARALANHRFKEIALAQQLRQQQSAAMRKMLAQRESSGHSVEHQHYESRGGCQSVSSDIPAEGCSRFSQSQQQLHLPAPPASGSKILPFLRSMFHQRSRPGSLHDSPSSPSLKREAVAGTRGTAAGCVGNSKSLALAREATVAHRAPANARTGQRTSQQMSSPFEEHERDEGEWLRGDLSRENNANTNTNALSNSNLTDWTAAFGPSYSTPWSNSSQSWSLQQQQGQQRMLQAMPPPVPPYAGRSRCHASPSSMAAPVRIRTSIPVCSAPPPRSEFLNSDTNLIPPVPAVRVRSVIPVCSAPPAEQAPDKSTVGEADGGDSTLQLLNQLRL